jgi:PAS domain-containing protein
VKQSARRIAIMLGIVIATTVVQWRTTQQVFEQQEHVASQRLMKMSAGLIERAHDMRDDLMIQNVIRTLGETPGMLFACVTNGENRILAHNQPSRLGETLKFNAGVPGTWSYILQEGNKPWGRLIFRISRGTLISAYARLLMVMILVAIILAVVFLLSVAQWQSKLSQKEHEKTELRALLDEETKNACSSEERRRATLQQNLVWLQDAVNQIPSAVLLLDEHQRVVAVNQRTRATLNIDGPENLIGVSWQDIPYLRESGQRLAESIEKPGITIQSSANDGGVTHNFMTTSRQDSRTGTWVTFFGVGSL